MTSSPALTLRDALESVRRHAPQDYVIADAALPTDRIASDFATRFAGIPATSASRPEKVVRYAVPGSPIPVLLGLYGCPSRVRGWFPGLAARTNPTTVARLLGELRPPQPGHGAACQQRIETGQLDLGTLPVLRATPRDAGPYLTMGVVSAQDPDRGELTLSTHRMLVLDRHRLAIWMVPGRRLRELHEAALHAGTRLPVGISIGAPPAAMLASALSTAVLPPGVSKLTLAGALAGEPISTAAAVSQPLPVLAASEIVLEGYLDHSVADETLDGPLSVSLPEFLGYDGEAKRALPVVTVTALTSRLAPIYQAVIGPGREQSVILGLAGALSVALTGFNQGWQMITDLHYCAAGGGMLLLVIAVRKDSEAADGRLGALARCIFDRHRFVKLIVFTDDDVDITSTEDVCWAITTRSNLGTDCITLPGYSPLPMDPSQRPEWAAARGADGASARSFIDATTPYRLRHATKRSFPTLQLQHGPLGQGSGR
ncbi:MAG: UbiD family decarboxylase [Pseudonocardiales bacterium]|nr:UbiD family decarboxylase [Pseudonocardiales bacterium]